MRMVAYRAVGREGAGPIFNAGDVGNSYPAAA